MLIGADHHPPPLALISAPLTQGSIWCARCIQNDVRFFINRRRRVQKIKRHEATVDRHYCSISKIRRYDLWESCNRKPSLHARLGWLFPPFKYFVRRIKAPLWQRETMPHLDLESRAAQAHPEEDFGISPLSQNRSLKLFRSPKNSRAFRFGWICTAWEIHLEKILELKQLAILQVGTTVFPPFNSIINIAFRWNKQACKWRKCGVGIWLFNWLKNIIPTRILIVF